MVLGPEFPHTAKNAGSAARKEALAILESRGNSPRTYRNTLVMLAADSNRLRELQSAVRQFLAWDSIWDDRDLPNLAKAAADAHSWIYQQKANAITVGGNDVA